MSLVQYEKIPGNTFAYWISNAMINGFRFEGLDRYFNSRIGLVTGDVDRFLKYWYEVNNQNINFSKKYDETIKWYPYQKGGSFRKWFGNNEYVVNWENNGYEMTEKNTAPNGRVKSHNYNGDFAFKKGITWTKITTGEFSARFVDDGFMFDDAGCMGFANNDKIHPILAFLNSKVGRSYLKFFKGEDMNCLPGHLSKIPFPCKTISSFNLQAKTKECIEISIQDWDSFETSWDFKKHPLI